MEMESRLSGRDIGFDAPDADDDHAPPSPVAYLRADGEDPSQMYERRDEEDSTLAVLREGLANLDARSRDIIKRRWLDDENRSEEHTSELQSLMRLSYTVFCLKIIKQTHN